MRRQADDAVGCRGAANTTAEIRSAPHGEGGQCLVAKNLQTPRVLAAEEQRASTRCGWTAAVGCTPRAIRFARAVAGKEKRRQGGVGSRRWRGSLAHTKRAWGLVPGRAVRVLRCNRDSRKQRARHHHARRPRKWAREQLTVGWATADCAGRLDGPVGREVGATDPAQTPRSRGGWQVCAYKYLEGSR